MKSLYDYYAGYYIHLALCTVLITAFTYKAIASEINGWYCIWAGAATIMIYNFRPVFHFRDGFTRSYIIKVFLYLSVIAMAVYIHFGFNISIGAMLLAGILCLGYFNTLYGTRFSLRQHYLLKPFVIGAVFAIVTAYIPALSAGYSVSESLLMTLGRCGFIVSLAILFDIGDVQEDMMSPTMTLPQKTGITRTKQLAAFILTASACVDIYTAWIFLMEFPACMALMITYVFTFIVIWYAEKNRPSWYFLILADGMMALPWIISHI